MMSIIHPGMPILHFLNWYTSILFIDQVIKLISTYLFTYICLKLENQ